MNPFSLIRFLSLSLVFSVSMANAQSLADVLSSIQERQLLQEQKATMPEYLWDVAAGGDTGGYDDPNLIGWDSLPDFPVETSTTSLTMEQRLGLLNKAVKEFDRLKTEFLNVSSQRLDEAATGDIKMGLFHNYTEYDLPSPGLVTPDNYRQKLRELAIKVTKLRVVSWPVLGDRSYTYGSKTINTSGTGHKPTTIDIANLNQQVDESDKVVLEDFEGWGEYATVSGGYVDKLYPGNNEYRSTTLHAQIHVTKELTYREAPDGWTDTVAGNSYVVSRRRYSPASDITVGSESEDGPAGTVEVLYKLTEDGDQTLHSSTPGVSVTGTWEQRSENLGYDEWSNFVPTGCSLEDAEAGENYSAVFEIGTGADTEWMVFRRDYSLVFAATFSRGLDETGNGVLHLLDTLPPTDPSDGTIAITPDPGLLFTIDLGIGMRGASAAAIGVYHPGHDDRRDTAEVQDRDMITTEGQLGPPITTNESKTYDVGYPSLGSDLRIIGPEEDFIVFYEGGRSDPPAWNHPVEDKNKGWFAANFEEAWEKPRLRQIIGRTIIADFSPDASSFSTTITLYRRLPSSTLDDLTSPVEVSGTPLATYVLGPNGALDAAGLPVSEFSLKISESTARQWTFDPAASGSDYDFHNYTIAWKDGTTTTRTRTMVADDAAGTVVFTDTEGSVTTATVRLDKGYVGFPVPQGLGPVVIIGPPANVLDPVFAVKTVTRKSGTQNLVQQFTPDARYPTSLTITDPLHPTKSWQWLASGLPSATSDGSWSTAYSVEDGHLKAEHRYGSSLYATTWTGWASDAEQETVYSTPDGSITSKTDPKADSVVLDYYGASDTTSGAIPLELKGITRKDLTGSTYQYNLDAGTLQVVTRSGAKPGDDVTRGREADEQFNEIGLPDTLTISEIGGVTLQSLVWGDLTSWGAPQQVVSDPQQLTSKWTYDGQRLRLASSQDVLGVPTAYGSYDVLGRLKSYTWNSHAGTYAYNNAGIGVTNTLTMTGLGNRGGSVAFDGFGNVNSISQQAGRPLDLTMSRGSGQAVTTLSDSAAGADITSTIQQDDGSLVKAKGTILPFDGNTGTGLAIDNGLFKSTTQVAGQTATTLTTWTDAWGRVRKTASSSASGGGSDETQYLYSDPGSSLKSVRTIDAAERKFITESDPYNASGVIRRSGIDMNGSGSLAPPDRYVESVTTDTGSTLVTTLSLTENGGLREILRTEWDPSNNYTTVKINRTDGTNGGPETFEESITREPDYTAKTVTTSSSKGWSKTETFNTLGLTETSTLSGIGIPTSNLNPTWRDDGSLASVSLSIGNDAHSATFNTDGTLATLNVPGRGNSLAPNGHTISGGVESMTIDDVTNTRKLDGTEHTTSGGDVIGKRETVAPSGTGFTNTIHPTIDGTSTAMDTSANFNAAGAPTAKTYPDASGETYTNYAGGLLHTVSLARGGSLEFGYSSDGAKDLISAVWPAVVSGTGPGAFAIAAVAQGYGYDRAGRLETVGDSSGGRSITYQNGRLKQTTWTSGALSGYKVIRGLDDSGRDTGFQLWRGNALIHSAGKTPNGVSGEISDITSGNLKIVIGRNAASQITGFQWGNATGNFTPAVTHTWVRGVGGRIEAAASDVTGAPSFTYLITGHPDSYSFDHGRRLKCATPGGEWTYAYTSGQLTSASHTTLGSFTYYVDGIGRRTNVGDDTKNDLLNRTLAWTNSQTKTLKVTAAPGAHVWVGINGGADTQITGFTGEASYSITPPGSTGGWVPWHTLAVLNGQGEGTQGANPIYNPLANPDAKAEQSGAVWVPPVAESFHYDNAGNRESSALWDYGWNAKNELVRARTKGFDTAAKGYDVTFGYDSEGRRYRKHVIQFKNGTLVSEEEITFVWDGWDMIYERHQLTSGLTTLERKYMWGPDIADGGAGGAGGAGGLLLIRETKGNTTQDIYPLYDGTGHVVALTNANKDLLAAYAYGPFGELIHATGPAAQANPWRYATKYRDEETGLYYFGRRYLDPVTGQWLSRELLGEDESLNLYAYCHNDPVNKVDVLGLAPAGLNPEQSKIFDEILAKWPIRERLNDGVTAEILGIMRMDGNLHDGGRMEQAARLDAYETQVGDVYRKNPKLINAVAGISSAVIHMVPGNGPQGAGASDGSNTTFMLAVDTFRLFGGSLIALDPGSPRSFRNEFFPGFVAGYNSKYSYGQRTGAEIAMLVMPFVASKARPILGEAFSGMKLPDYFSLSETALARPGLPGMVRNPIHHIATAKNSISTLRGGPWTPRFEGLFNEAGMTLENSLNKIAVPGHFGPHPEAYHSAVFNRLVEATQGLSGAPYADALRAELISIQSEVITSGSYLNSLITK